MQCVVFLVFLSLEIISSLKSSPTCITKRCMRGGMQSLMMSSLSEDVMRGAQQDQKLQVEHMFRAMMTNSEFVEDYWQKKPLFLSENMPNLAGAYTMTDVEYAVENDFVEAGRGTLEGGQGGWNMAAVSTPRGNSFEDAKLRFQDVQASMKKKSGTVVFNSAGGFIPPLAGVCLDTMNAFDMPTAINMYLTDAGQQVSAPPHTDKQDVFVLQTQGKKHWRVFAPPPPSAMPKNDPYARGKANDVLKMEELGEPLVDVVLEPGQVLYVPGGWPHTTDTLAEFCGEGSDPSVHLTVGIDTHIWGLTYASLRGYTLRRKKLWDKLRLTKIDTDLYFDLNTALPLGVLAEPLVEKHKELKGFGSGLQRALAMDIKEAAVSKCMAAEPTRWESRDALEADIGYQLDEAIPRVMKHHVSMVDTQKKMYRDVAFKISPSKMDISFFRSQPYFQDMEQLMSGMEAWPEHGTDLGEAPPKDAGPMNDLAAAKQKKGGMKAVSGGGGFGKK